ncbi:MAG: outer membrane protein assembly factor BamE [Lachnospiraceae bacterium]|nr:outer membrane protein assembly factor BamE [Lachnospiraceae bacterium]
MEKWTAQPTQEVNGIRFGMNREEVRKLLGTAKEFKKTKFSLTTTDDFGICHVFYNEQDQCEAIEIFSDVEISVNGQVIFPADVAQAKLLIEDLVMEDDSLISESLSIGIYAPGGRMESILFGEAGYYG